MKWRNIGIKISGIEKLINDRKRGYIRIAMAFFIHFLVDFTCAYWMFHMVFRQGTVIMSGCYIFMADYRYIWFLVYHFCALALQFPIGCFVDRYCQKRPWRIASLGCLILVITGAVILKVHFSATLAYQSYWWRHILFFSIALGIGNALFHVGTGVEILQLAAQGDRTVSRKGSGRRNPASVLGIDHRMTFADDMEYRMAPIGIFVSTGALGVYLGKKLAVYLQRTSVESVYDIYITPYWQIICFYSLLAIGLLLVTAGLNSYLHKRWWQAAVEDCSCRIKEGRNGRLHVWMILSLILIFALYSFQGGVTGFSWWGLKKAVLLFTLCGMLGRAMGGLLADHIGIWWSTILPLGGSAILFCLVSDQMIPSLVAILLFQITVPIVIAMMHWQLPGRPGAVLGLGGMGLFLGTLPKTAVDLQKITLFAEKKQWFAGVLQKFAVCGERHDIMTFFILLFLFPCLCKYLEN